MENKPETIDVSNKRKEMFFREQDKSISKLINSLIEFRLDIGNDQKKELKNFFNSIKEKADTLGYYELSKLGEYYENYVDSVKEINENSHELFSDILKGTGLIKRHISQLKIKNNYEKIYKNTNEKTKKCSIGSTKKKGNILLLDDDLLISAILKDAFEAEGYNIMTTTNPDEAIEHILYKDINIALIDIIMPKMNGFEVFEILKRNGVDIPIIFLSGKSVTHYKVDALSRGVDDYITKPFEIKEVIARVTRSLGRSNQYKNKLNKDKLTGAYNKEFFNEHVSDIISNKEHLKQNFSVAFMDLDDFKYINDNYGHIVGDYALKDFSCFLKDNLQENDMIFRFGGDEFVVLFVDKDMEQSYINIENLRKKLNETVFKYKDLKEDIKLNASIGITYIYEDDNVEEVLDRADKCLYSSKKLGKNTTVCSDKMEIIR